MSFVKFCMEIDVISLRCFTDRSSWYDWVMFDLNNPLKSKLARQATVMVAKFCSPLLKNPSVVPHHP